MRKPSFKKDLAFGQESEALFLKLWPELGLTQTDGRKGDLVDKYGVKWELKTDRYDHEATPNLFLEVYSDVDRGKLGGPAQALLNNCRYYVYFYVKNQIAYVYDTAKLVDAMRTVAMGQPISIQNARWTTIGHKVPRALLTPELVLTKDKK